MTTTQKRGIMNKAQKYNAIDIFVTLKAQGVPTLVTKREATALAARYAVEPKRQWTANPQSDGGVRLADVASHIARNTKP
jgi:hypothetical protein